MSGVQRVCSERKYCVSHFAVCTASFGNFSLLTTRQAAEEFRHKVPKVRNWKDQMRAHCTWCPLGTVQSFGSQRPSLQANLALKFKTVCCRTNQMNQPFLRSSYEHTFKWSRHCWELMLTGYKIYYKIHSPPQLIQSAGWESGIKVPFTWFTAQEPDCAVLHNSPLFPSPLASIGMVPLHSSANGILKCIQCLHTISLFFCWWWWWWNFNLNSVNALLAHGRQSIRGRLVGFAPVWKTLSKMKEFAANSAICRDLLDRRKANL